MSESTPAEIAVPSEWLSKFSDLRSQPSPDWQDPGLRIELRWRIRLGGPGIYGAGIYRERITKSGNPGNPEHIITLTDDGSPADLLRRVADIIDPNGPELVAKDEA